MASKSNSQWRRRQRAFRLVETARLSIPLCAPLSAWVLNQRPSRFSLWIKTDQTLVRQFHCVFLYCSYVCISERDPYPEGFVVWFGCFWRRIQSICTLRVLFLYVVCPPEYGSASTKDEIRTFVSVFVAWCASLLSGANVFGCISFRNFFCESTTRANFWSNHLKTLHMPWSGFHFVMLNF